MQKNETRMLRVQLRLSSSALAQLDLLAAANGLNRSAMVRLLISKAIAASGNGPGGLRPRSIEDH